MGNAKSAQALRKDLENKQLEKASKNDVDMAMLAQIPNIEARLVLLENRVKELVSEKEPKKSESKKDSKGQDVGNSGDVSPKGST